MNLNPEFSETLETVNRQAVPEFLELLEMAREVCLRDGDVYNRHLQRLSGEQKDGSEAQMSLWGLRAAIESGNEYDLYKYGDEKKQLEANPRDFIPDALLDVQRQIEAFGESLLEEAFLCLGDDAQDYVRKFNDAKDEQAQIEVVDWLLNRVDDMARPLKNSPGDSLAGNGPDNRPDNEDGNSLAEDIDALALLTKEETDGVNVNDDTLNGEYFYHPVRLSPKLVGTYPDVNLRPTCLGKSILFASFFNKTNSSFVHAGVMRTVREATRLHFIQAADSILWKAEKDGIGLNSAAVDKLEQFYRDNAQIIVERGNQFHATVLARLINGAWVQIDPNYHSNIIYNDYESERLSNIYQSIQEAPGVESSYVNEMGMFAAIFDYIVYKQLKNLRSAQEVHKDLESIEQGPDLLTSVADYVFDRFCEGLYHDLEEEVPRIEDVYDSGMFGEKNKATQKYNYVEGLAQRIVESYIFPDLSEVGEEKVRHLLATDEGYRQRRIEDLMMAPLYFTISWGSKAANAKLFEYNIPHATLEVGTPAHRIGAAVLSEFALFTEAEIPFSFWASQWPSYVTFGNHVPPEKDRLQRQTLKQLYDATRSSFLAYFSSRGIINKFLEQEGEL